MKEEQIRQNAKNFAINETGGLAIKYFPCEKGFIAGAHSRDEEIKELEQALACAEDVVDIQRKELGKLRNPWRPESDPPLHPDGKIISEEVIAMFSDGSIMKAVYHNNEYTPPVWKDANNGFEIDPPIAWMPIPKLRMEE